MRFQLVLMGLWFSTQGLAVEDIDCQGRTSNYRDIIACAEERSPDVQKANAELKRAHAQVKSAGQYKNPQLSVSAVSGQLGAEGRSETDISLGVPLELGGKISARELVASGVLSSAEAKLYSAKAKVKAIMVLRLHRLRQVLHEQEIINEAIGTFSKLINQYKRRPALSAEQQVSLSVYQLALSDYELKRASTLEELAEIESFLQFNVGLNIHQIQKHVPESLKSWPALVVRPSAADSPQRRLLTAELSVAQGELAVARSEAWPTVTLGPAIRLQQELGLSGQMVGVNLNMPLPLFNLNGKARATAAMAVTAVETRRDFGIKELDINREKLRKIYEQSVKTLMTSISHQEIEKRHNDADAFFNKGIVPSALIIEAHRTSLDLEKARHQRELRTLETLLEILTMDGVILEEQL